MRINGYELLVKSYIIVNEKRKSLGTMRKKERKNDGKEGEEHIGKDRLCKGIVVLL